MTRRGGLLWRLTRKRRRGATATLDARLYRVRIGLLVGAIVVIGAVSLELAAGPPFWVHILIWPAITLGLVIGGLRLGKAVLLISEYRNAAREGKLKS